MIKFGLFSVNSDLSLTNLAQKIRIRTFFAKADLSGSTANPLYFFQPIIALSLFIPRGFGRGKKGQSITEPNSHFSENKYPNLIDIVALKRADWV